MLYLFIQELFFNPLCEHNLETLTTVKPQQSGFDHTDSLLVAQKYITIKNKIGNDAVDRRVNVRG